MPLLRRCFAIKKYVVQITTLTPANRSPSTLAPLVDAAAKTTIDTPAKATPASDTRLRRHCSPNSRGATSSTSAGCKVVIKVALAILVSLTDANPVSIESPKKIPGIAVLFR